MREDEAGFSLIEALVALALGAVVMATVLTTVKTGADMATRLVRSGQQDDALSQVADLLTGDVQHALGLALTADGALVIGDGQSLRFAMLPRPQMDAPDAGPVIVTYRVEPGPPSHLTRVETPVQAGQAVTATVWDSDRPMQFVYLDGRSHWQSQWRTPALPPRAIGLAIGSGQNESPQIAAAFLPLLPIGCAAGGTPAPECLTMADTP